MTLHPVALIIGIVVAVVLLIAALLFLFLRHLQRGKNTNSLETSLQNLTQTIQQEQVQIATLTEKVTHIEPLPQTIGSIEVELRGLSERVSKVEQNQTAVNHDIGVVAMGLAQTGAAITSKVSDSHQQSVNSLYQVSSGLAGELSKAHQDSSTAFAELKALSRGLTEATASMRSELAKAKNDLTELQTNARARQEIELQTANSIKRLETIIAGTQTKGAAGENILEVVFAKLPADWQVRNFKVGGKPVEFGLRLPNNLILPIDSKWAATNLLEQFIAATDTIEQQRLKEDIETVVIQKAKEVRKYIDPSVTAPFGVAVVPDAIYDLCAGIQAEIFQLNVVLVSYSMFIPYLLLVFQTILKTGQNIDLQKLDSYLQTAQSSIDAMQKELDGRFSKAVTMLDNSRSDLRVHISKIGSSLAGLQISAATPVATPALPEPE